MARLMDNKGISAKWVGVTRQVVAGVCPTLSDSRTASARPSNDAVAESKAADAVLLPADLISGDETIIFAIKPSLWYVVFDSTNWVLAALCMIAGASFWADSFNLSEPQFMSAVLAVLSLRIGLALLRWVSRFYVLTNRRVMRVRGVSRPDIYECPLVNIRNTTVTTSFPEALTRLGTIKFVTTDPADSLRVWRAVADADNIHNQIRKAIERAIDCQPRI